MTYQRRAAAPTNTIKLTFDFDTLDKLKARASLRKVDTQRCAYELIQESLGIRAVPAIELQPAVAELADEMTERVRRSFDEIRNYRSPAGR